MTVRNRILRRLVSSAGVAAMLLAAPVYAQTTDGNGGDDQGTGIGDIIVTANKRSENLQKTPAAITALSGVLIATVRIPTIARMYSDLMPRSVPI